MWRWDVSWMVLWLWGRLLFKHEDMKEGGVFLFGEEREKAVVRRWRRLLWWKSEGCCGKIYQGWKGDSLFSGFWARGQRRRPLDLGLNPKLAGRNILGSIICPIRWRGGSRFQQFSVWTVHPGTSIKLWFAAHRFQVFLWASITYDVSASAG